MSGAIMASTGQSWMTPPKIVDAVLKAFGGTIDLDPCGSSDVGTVPAKKKFTGPKAWGGDGNDGLSVPWWGPGIKTVFVNPPFGSNKPHPEILGGIRPTSIYDWVERCAVAASHGSRVITIIPAATDTHHWHDSVWPKASSICFLKGRVRFWMKGPDGKPVPAKASTFHACAVVHFGDRASAFNRAFETMGHIVEPNTAAKLLTVA